MLDLVRVLGVTEIETWEEDEIEREKSRRTRERIRVLGDAIDESARRHRRRWWENFKRVESEEGSK